MTKVETGLGGLSVWYKDKNGFYYYHAHLNAIKSSLQVGTILEAGEIFATVGNTGDARGGAPHLHFEIRKPDFVPINPYRELLAVDPFPPAP